MVRDSRFNAQREVLTHGYRGFKVFLALFADQLASQVRSSDGRETTSRQIVIINKCNASTKATVPSKPLHAHSIRLQTTEKTIIPKKNQLNCGNNDK